MRYEELITDGSPVGLLRAALQEHRRTVQYCRDRVQRAEEELELAKGGFTRAVQAADLMRSWCTEHAPAALGPKEEQ